MNRNYGNEVDNDPFTPKTAEGLFEAVDVLFERLARFQREDAAAKELLARAWQLCVENVLAHYAEGVPGSLSLLLFALGAGR